MFDPFDDLDPFQTPNRRINDVRRDLTEATDEVTSLRWRLSDAESRIDRLEEAVRTLAARLDEVAPDDPEQ